MKKHTPAIMAVIVVLGVAPWLVFWSSLPEDVATHWDISGHANGHLSRVVALLVLGGVSVALAAGALLQRTNVASPVIAFVGSVIASASLGTVLANKDEPSWPSAHLGLVWVIVGILAGAGAARVYAQAIELPTPGPIGDRPVLALGDTETVAWIGSSTSRWLQLTALGCVVFGVVALLTLPEPSGVVVTLAAVLLAHVATVHVTITREGVRVRGAFGWPGVTIPIDRVESADTSDVNPWKWGGWGYRGSLTLMRRAAWNTRSGSGMHLILKGNKEFVVTVDGADEAAAVVNGLLARPTSTAR